MNEANHTIPKGEAQRTEVSPTFEYLLRGSEPYKAVSLKRKGKENQLLPVQLNPQSRSLF